MANYEATARTNYFRVTDEEKYAKLVDGLTAEFCVNDFSKDVDGVLYHGFGAYGTIDWMDENDDNDFDRFLSELQKILPEDEAVIYMETGHEKLRYLTAYGYCVTKDRIESVNLESQLMKKASEMLGFEFDTEMEY